ncbi:MAG TPA: helix-turn-helix domain-containing protein [Bacteroidia bacterium]|nr:helix-turn-helix domain-containing protein [Bacteroidia bacterium]
MTSKPPSPTRRVLTFAEFAEAIAVSKRQLYRLIDDGKAPKPFKIGVKLCYANEDLDTYLEQLKRTRK